MATKKSTKNKSTKNKSTKNRSTKRPSTAKRSKNPAKKNAAPNKGAKKSAATAGLIGKTVPELTLQATGGQSVSLPELAGKKVVLYFYPKDMTPGCTIEGHDFTKLQPQFLDTNTVVYGISRDTVDSHEKFKTKECYTIDLLSDPDEKLCQAFGVIKMKNMYGKMVRGIERSTFVIDENGQVVKEWRGVKVPGHAEEVLNFIKNSR